MNDVLLTPVEMSTFNARLSALTGGRLAVGPEAINRGQARALWLATKAFSVAGAQLALRRPQIKSGRRRTSDMHRTGAVVALSAVALSGCTTLGGNVKGNFACRAPDGICAPTSRIDDQALTMISGRDAEAMPAGIIGPSDLTDRRLEPVTASTAPSRTSDKVLRIVFPAHIDGSGRFREASAIHAVVERGGWMAAADRPAAVLVRAAEVARRQQVAMVTGVPSLAELAAASPEVAFAQSATEAGEEVAIAPATAADPNVPSAAVVAAARHRLHYPAFAKPAARGVSLKLPKIAPVLYGATPAPQYAVSIPVRAAPANAVQPALPNLSPVVVAPQMALVAVPASVSAFDLRNAGTASPLSAIRDQVGSILARTPKAPVAAAAKPLAPDRPVNGPAVLSVSGVEK